MQALTDFLNSYRESLDLDWKRHFSCDLPDLDWDFFVNKGTARYFEALSSLPQYSSSSFSVSDTDFSVSLFQDAFDAADKGLLHDAFQALKPWRKGPFSVGDLFIDSEWRCDLKWNRIQHDFSGQSVLDVGCGNGYYMWRILEAGAHSVVGCDPTALYFFQYLLLRHFCQRDDLMFLPCGYQAFEGQGATFDTVLSMGVLYHQKNVFEHLKALKSLIKAGGTLLLETLIISSDEQIALCPERYANMKNVYFVPSQKTLLFWLDKAGFKDIHVQDITRTTVDEQRVTSWSNDVSLSHALDPQDETKTIEGYESPLRILLSCHL